MRRRIIRTISNFGTQRFCKLAVPFARSGGPATFANVRNSEWNLDKGVSVHLHVHGDTSTQHVRYIQWGGNFVLVATLMFSFTQALTQWSLCPTGMINRYPSSATFLTAFWGLQTKMGILVGNLTDFLLFIYSILKKGSHDLVPQWKLNKHTDMFEKL